MDTGRFLIYLLVMAGVTYLIRMLPLILVRKKIQNRFVLSFLAYVPYAVLSCMTFPAVIYSAGSIYAGLAGTLTGLFFSYKKKSLLFVAVASCTAALIVNAIFSFL
ncbi:MAG: AzlD domain-containing protein [Lachnospiraceae bacterium]|jgi:branched-subunit amino acid transport protein|nr:AzlD domain-containing protein [Lachnospiraceae bacterium]MEE3460475.1 AzlD domain-containing protein [Lachnospiraceae bacterium]